MLTLLLPKGWLANRRRKLLPLDRKFPSIDFFECFDINRQQHNLVAVNRLQRRAEFLKISVARQWYDARRSNCRAQNGSRVRVFSLNLD